MPSPDFPHLVLLFVILLCILMSGYAYGHGQGSQVHHARLAHAMALWQVGDVGYWHTAAVFDVLVLGDVDAKTAMLRAREQFYATHAVLQGNFKVGTRIGAWFLVPASTGFDVICGDNILSEHGWEPLPHDPVPHIGYFATVEEACATLLAPYSSATEAEV